MDAVKYVKEKARMTKVNTHGYCATPCCECGLSNKNNGRNIDCARFENLYPEEAVAVVEKWSEEHKLKTRAQVFFEKFPDAPKHEDGRPRSCPMYCGLAENCLVIHDNKPLTYCKKCWNEPAPDKYQDWSDK